MRRSINTLFPLHTIANPYEPCVHRFLTPLWVIPEYQGRGVAGMLLKEVIDLADKELPPTAIYLEASERGRPVYQRFGFEPVDPGPDREVCMVRRGPRKNSV